MNRSLKGDQAGHEVGPLGREYHSNRSSHRAADQYDGLPQDLLNECNAPVAVARLIQPVTGSRPVGGRKATPVERHIEGDYSPGLTKTEIAQKPMVLTRVGPSRVEAEERSAVSRCLGIDGTTCSGRAGHLMIPPLDSLEAAPGHCLCLRHVRSQVLDQHLKEGQRLRD